MSENIKYTVSAPGKIILTGEHSVVFGEPAIASSISMRTYCTLETNNDEIISLKFINYNFQHSFNLNEIQKIINENNLNIKEEEFSLENADILSSIDISSLILFYFNHLNLQEISLCSKIQNSIKLIIFLFHTMFQSVNINPEGFHISINTDLTISAGTGSSASFAVTIATVIYIYIKYICKQQHIKNDNNISKHKYKQCMLNVEQWDCLNKKDKEIVNQWAFLAEKITHGKPSGLDNTICTYGSMVQLTRRLEGTDIQLLGDVYQLDILLINTGHDRNTASLVQKVCDLKKRHEFVLADILKSMGSVTNSFLFILKKLAKIELSNDKNKNQLIEIEFKKLEELIDINQGLLISLGVSHPLLDKIITICKTYNLHAKLTGAGGGGYAFAIIPPNFNRDILENCIKQLKNENFQVHSNIKLGGNGLKLENTEKI